jgi:hypothetical protein
VAPPGNPSRPWYQRYEALLALLGLHGATVGTLFLASSETGWSFCAFGPDGGWAACDQPYHIDQINYFIVHPAAWLHYPDPWQTATFPGFHLFIAQIARLLGLRELGTDTWLRFIPFLLGGAVLWLLWRIFHTLSGDARYAALLCVPILWSNYFYQPSLFLVTENAAYLGYAFLLLAYLEFPRRGLAIGAAGAATVFVRQIYLPVVITPAILLLECLRRVDARAIRDASLAMLPAFLLFLVYYIAWGGPVPPEEIGEHGAHALIETGPFIQAIALTGVLAIPYGFLTARTLAGLSKRRFAAIVALAICVSLVLWLGLPSTRNEAAGRLGSIIWLLAGYTPLDHEHALLVLPCLALGCIALGVIVEFARSRRYLPVELIMFGLYLGALSLQRLSYQRYSEVVTLILLSATAARLGPPPRWGIALFVIAFSAKFLVTLVMPQGG